MLDGAMVKIFPLYADEYVVPPTATLDSPRDPDSERDPGSVRSPVAGDIIMGRAATPSSATDGDGELNVKSPFPISIPATEK